MLAYRGRVAFPLPVGLGCWAFRALGCELGVGGLATGAFTACFGAVLATKSSRASSICLLKWEVRLTTVPLPSIKIVTGTLSTPSPTAKSPSNPPWT